MRETRVQSLGGEDPLEKETVTNSSILAWRILWTQELSGLQTMGWQRVRHNLATQPTPPMFYKVKRKFHEKACRGVLCQPRPPPPAFSPQVTFSLFSVSSALATLTSWLSFFIPLLLLSSGLATCCSSAYNTLPPGVCTAYSLRFLHKVTLRSFP